MPISSLRDSLPQRLALALGLSLALSLLGGCDSAPGGDPAGDQSGAASGTQAISEYRGARQSEEEMRANAALLVKPEPGLYRSLSRLEHFALPNAAPGDAARMQAMMGGLEPQESTSCLTREQADEGFLAFFRALEQGDCRIESFDVQGTSMHAEMVCSGIGQSISRVTMSGTGEPTRSSLQLEVRQQASSLPGGRMDMRFVVENQRLGEC